MRVRHALGGTFLPAGLVLFGAVVVACGSSSGRDGDLRSGLESLLTPDVGGTVSFDGSAPPPPFDASPPPFDASPDGNFFPDGSLPDGGNPGAPSGFWHFDDCSPKTTTLLDSSGNGETAEHRLGSSCVPGVSGQAISLTNDKNVVEIPDDPAFAVSERIAVAAWINPVKISGTHPILVKELGGEGSFELAVHSGNIEFTVHLTTGKSVKSSAPITAGTWQHVAALYDGHFVFLVLNGQQVGQVDRPGVIRDVRSAIRVGASSSGQAFDGAIDEVWISTNQVTPADLEALACARNPSSFTFSQSPAGPVLAGTAVNYGVTVTNNDVGFCPSGNFFFQSEVFNSGGGISTGGGGFDAGAGSPVPDAGFIAPPSSSSIPIPPPPNGGASDAGGPEPIFDAGTGDGGFDAGPPPPPLPLGANMFANPSFATIAPGQSFTFNVTATTSDDADPGNYNLPFEIFGNNVLTGTLPYDITSPAGCHVTTGRELMIVDPSVVDDPVRTSFASGGGSTSTGVWTFGRLMRDMAPTPEQAPAMVLGLFQSWLTDQTVNGFTVSARPAMKSTVLDSWPRLADGSLDLDHSPLRLLAIVNRMDTRNLAEGNAGEGRFVFGVLDPFGGGLQFTVIVEYALIANTEADVLAWANAWHALGSHPFPSAEYNAALEALTLKFSGRGAAPSRPNGSALDQLRTNEIALSFQWELREFGLSAQTGMLQERTVALTPDLSLNGSANLAKFINDNAATVIANTDVVPLSFNGTAFLGGSVFNNLTTWSAPGINDNEARFQFSSNTCNGCHGPDTNTTFLMLNPRSPGSATTMSPFLTGTTAFDQVSGQQRPLDDLGRRNKDLTGLVCGTPSAGAAPNAQGTTIAKGFRRTH